MRKQWGNNNHILTEIFLEKEHSWEDTNSMVRDQKFKIMLFFLENDRWKKLVAASSQKYLNPSNFYSMKLLKMEAPWCTLGNRHTPWVFYLIFSTNRTMVGTVIKNHLAHILISALLGIRKNLRKVNHPNP